MFVFPHPDDELAVAGLLRRLALSGKEICCVWAHSNPVREKESRTAMKVIGLSPEMHFLGMRDAKLLEDANLIVEVLDRVVGKFQPDALAVSAFEQGHLDHDVLNFLVSKYQTAASLWEYPLYRPYTTRFPQVGCFDFVGTEYCFPLTLEEQAFKVKMLSCYPSQTIRRNMVWAQFRERKRGRSLLTYEALLPMPESRDYSVPAAPERFRKAILRSSKWEKWREFVSRFPL